MQPPLSGCKRRAAIKRARRNCDGESAEKVTPTGAHTALRRAMWSSQMAVGRYQIATFGMSQ